MKELSSHAEPETPADDPLELAPEEAVELGLNDFMSDRTAD